VILANERVEPRSRFRDLFDPLHGRGGLISITVSEEHLPTARREITRTLNANEVPGLYICFEKAWFLAERELIQDTVPMDHVMFLDAAPPFKGAIERRETTRSDRAFMLPNPGNLGDLLKRSYIILRHITSTTSPFVDTRDDLSFIPKHVLRSDTVFLLVDNMSVLGGYADESSLDLFLDNTHKLLDRMPRAYGILFLDSARRKDHFHKRIYRACDVNVKIRDWM